MSSTQSNSGLWSGLVTATLLSVVGGGAVYFTTSSIGHAITAAIIGLIIGLGIFAVIATGASKGDDV